MTSRTDMSSDTATTVAMLTPAGRGAVAVIAVTGASALQLVERFFKPKAPPPVSDRPLERIIYGRWGNEPAEDVIACRRSEQCLEVHCHGGVAAVRRIIDDLVAAGAEERSWRDDVIACAASPIAAAARVALAEAATARTAEILQIGRAHV